MAGTEARTRTVGTLSGSDIGTNVTLNAPSWSITGRLYEVSHEGEQVAVSDGHEDPYGHFLTRQRVTLTIGPWSGEVSPDTAVSTA